MVTDQAAEECFFHSSLKLNWMEITLPIFCMLRTFQCRKHIHEFATDLNGIFHNIFCSPRMNIQSVDIQMNFLSIKVLIDKIAKSITIQSIGNVCTETFNVEFVSTKKADLFVTGETNLDWSVRKFWMFAEVFCHSHDGSDSCLVISAQQSGTVCQNQILTGIHGKTRIFGCFHYNIQFFI